MFGLNWMGSVDPRAAVEEVARGEAILLDVRTTAEFDAGHAIGAINFELSRLADGHFPPVGHTDPIYVYCQSGGRSAQATMLLKRAGFVRVSNLGGLSAWSGAGGPVEQSDGPTTPPKCEI